MKQMRAWWFADEPASKQAGHCLVMFARKSSAGHGRQSKSALIVSADDTPAWRVISPQRVNAATECARRGVLTSARYGASSGSELGLFAPVRSWRDFRLLNTSWTD